MKEQVYFTSFCNMAHRMSDGKPIDHECYIIPPILLKSEKEKGADDPETIGYWWNWTHGIRKIHKGIKS